ncbi:amidase domain-containing protein, partial [Domibacillus sp. 8LH]|uniref:amidase domain-containing protein n=1 Tax=Domibacillus sp. 8LH TaxID=3073900 RepID=UPI00317B859D
RMRFTYDRLAAVQYAERWWNSYNPNFRKFEVDCTNYISQCLLAGGAPMRGAPVRERGWWYNQDSWSFSWAVAHSMRWYLSGSTDG